MMTAQGPSTTMDSMQMLGHCSMYLAPVATHVDCHNKLEGKEQDVPRRELGARYTLSHRDEA